MYALDRLEHLIDQSRESVRDHYGGKAAGLLDALKLDLPIPDTWLVAAELYSRFHKAHPNPLHDEFLTLAARYVREHLKGLETLPEGRFAVRSSSLVEDSSSMSYAGIYDSILDVVIEDIPSAIASVWLSLSSKRSTSYEEGEHAMGVVIQPMVDYRTSGVLFSQHPSPTSVLEQKDILIEYSECSPEKVVAGEVVPERIEGTMRDLLDSDIKWVKELTESAEELRSALQTEVDIEFIVDKNDKLWIVQQRPISAIRDTKLLDLSGYTRKYKRKMATLDIELMIRGCITYLPEFFELDRDLSRWIVMTSRGGAQELWFHKELESALAKEIGARMIEDPAYVKRLFDDYESVHQEIRESDLSDLKSASEESWRVWHTHAARFAGHYYTPILAIEALYQVLLVEMDGGKSAEDDLVAFATGNTRSLNDILEEALIKCDGSSRAVEKICHEYGFLGCNQPYDKGYCAADLSAMREGLQRKEHASASVDSVLEKYPQVNRGLLEAFDRWMSIRNQEMEYLKYFMLQSRPFLMTIAERLACDLPHLWDAGIEEIASGSIAHEGQGASIYALEKSTHVARDLELVVDRAMQESALCGDVVFGEGIIAAEARIVYDSKDLEELSSDHPIVCVTGMTSPDFIPYMRGNIVALVTDEGGFLCHAAIIAREIGLPCIVGTERATEVITSGQQVTLNFSRGSIEAARD